MATPRLLIGRYTYLSIAWIIGIFSLGVALLTTRLAFSSIGNALTTTGQELRDNAAACSTFLTISGVAMGVVLYLVRMVFQREFDSAVEFTASVYAVPGK